MSEALSQDQKEIADNLHQEHKRLGNWVSQDEQDPTSDSPEGRENTKLNYDANLWRAHEHKEQHLDQYIETARQEAEAKDVHIELGQPKE